MAYIAVGFLLLFGFLVVERTSGKAIGGSFVILPGVYISVLSCCPIINSAGDNQEV